MVCQKTQSTSWTNHSLFLRCVDTLNNPYLKTLCPYVFKYWFSVVYLMTALLDNPLENFKRAIGNLNDRLIALEDQMINTDKYDSQITRINLD